MVDSQTEIMEINNFKSFDHLIDLVIEQINYVRESNELLILLTVTILIKTKWSLGMTVQEKSALLLR